MISLFITYLILLIIVSGVELFVKKTYADFVFAGGRYGFVHVCMSLFAMMIGASATLGVAASAEKVGFSATAWIIAGAVGLLLQGLLLTKAIRRHEAHTVPELARVVVGRHAQRLVALVIALSWPAVIAAQLVALSSIMEHYFGGASIRILVLLAGGVITLYTLVGGQRAIVRTDFFQMLFLIVGFVLLFVFLFSCKAEHPVSELDFTFFGSEYTWCDFLKLLPVVAGAYFLGPDITSRAFVAKSSNVARAAILSIVPMLLVFGLLVGLTGLWAAVNTSGSANPILKVAGLMPPFSSSLLVLGLIAALFSSADTCLINSSSIIANDILGIKSVKAVRLTVVSIGIASTLLAVFGKEIIELLFIAYSIYTPGIVMPLAVALFAKRVNERLWLLAVAAGGLLGVVDAAIVQIGWLSVAGMLLSGALAMVGTISRKSERV